MRNLVTKDFGLAIKSVGDSGIFEGYASVFDDVDTYKERVAKGAFVASLERHKAAGRMPALLWQHKSDEPLGVWSDMSEDDKGLLVAGELFTDQIQKAREAHALIKAGAISGLSIGFVPKSHSFDTSLGVTTLTEIDLWEVSLVTFPALQSARVTDVKRAIPFADLPLAPRDFPWTADSAEARVREWAGAGDGLTSAVIQRKYATAFSWVDEDDPENFGSYKLQFADVIDDNLIAIPRGIFAVAGVLLGARGGADIPEDDNVAVRRTVSRYYDKMREEFDDPDLIAPWDRRSQTPEWLRSVLRAAYACVDTEREFERFLRDAGVSKSEAVGITSHGFKRRKGDPAADMGELHRLCNILRL